MPERNESIRLDAEALDRIKSERLNETSKTCIDMAGKCLEQPTRDNALRRSSEARQWIELAIKVDKADADRKLAEIEVKLRQREEKAKKARKLRAV